MTFQVSVCLKQSWVKYRIPLQFNLSPHMTVASVFSNPPPTPLLGYVVMIEVPYKKKNKK